MKSSTLNPNIQAGLKTDNRYQALVKQEMAEHQHIISSHHKEMQTLRDSVKNALERFDSLFSLAEQELKEKTSALNDLVTQLQDKMKIHQVMSSDQKSTILSLYQELQDFYSIYSTKIDVEKLKMDIASEIKESNNNHIVSFQTYQQEMKALFQSLKDEFTKFIADTEEKVCHLGENIEVKFSLSKLNKDGVLKELRVYEKSMFIIEKKIENIYTLIERINKRDEICPKQE